MICPSAWMPRHSLSSPGKLLHVLARNDNLHNTIHRENIIKIKVFGHVMCSIGLPQSSLELLDRLSLLLQKQTSHDCLQAESAAVAIADPAAASFALVDPNSTYKNAGRGS